MAGAPDSARSITWSSHPAAASLAGDSPALFRDEAIDLPALDGHNVLDAVLQEKLGDAPSASDVD